MIDFKKGVRVFGHPLHPILSDFPIPLLGTSLLWDALGCLRQENLWWSISFWNICLGLAVSLFTAATGMFDYSKIADKHPAIGKATTHMMLMISAVSVYALSLVIRGGSGAPEGWKVWGAVGLEVLGLGLLGAGAWFGGELTIKHGLGRDA